MNVDSKLLKGGYEVHLTPTVLEELHNLQINEWVDEHIQNSEDFLAYLIDELSEMDSNDVQEYKDMSKRICGLKQMLRTFNRLKA